MAEKIKVKHVTNSLYQMEKWCRYLRLALYKMDPAMLLSTGDDALPAGSGGLLYRPPYLAMGCPPPPTDHDPDCTCSDCCGDDKKHHGKGGGVGGGRGSGRGGGKGSGKGGPKKKAARK